MLAPMSIRQLLVLLWCQPLSLIHPSAKNHTFIRILKEELNIYLICTYGMSFKSITSRLWKGLTYLARQNCTNISLCLCEHQLIINQVTCNRLFLYLLQACTPGLWPARSKNSLRKCAAGPGKLWREQILSLSENPKPGGQEVPSSLKLLVVVSIAFPAPHLIRTRRKVAMLDCCQEGLVRQAYARTAVLQCWQMFHNAAIVSLSNLNDWILHLFIETCDSAISWYNNAKIHLHH